MITKTIQTLPMDFLTIISLLFLTLSFIHCLKLIISTRLNKLPPGPPPLPVIGNLHLLGKQPHQSLTRLAKTYGPVMHLKLGQKTTVVISSSIMAKQVLQKQDVSFSNRTVLDAVRVGEHSNYSVVFLPPAAKWRSLRKITNSNIFSTKQLANNQALRNRKVEELVEYCKRKSLNSEVLDIGHAAFRTTLNLLSNTIFSKDLADPFSDSDKEFKSTVRGIMVEIGTPNLADYFPVFRKFDPQGIRRRTEIHFKKLFGIFSSLVDERLEQYKSCGVTYNDVLDILLSTSKESPEEIDRTHIEHLCLDLFEAGTDTTSSTVEWAMAETLRNPYIIQNSKAELEKVIGKGKVVKDEDISNLPYLQCIIKETFRLHPPAPFLVPRQVDQDVDLNGYTVPGNSQVLVNAWAIGREEGLWENVFEFKPDRFLDKEMDVKGTDFELTPFGGGRRICPGLPLAMKMVPIMVGTLLNTFDWEIEGGIMGKELDMGEVFGFTLQRAKPLRAIPIPTSTSTST